MRNIKRAALAAAGLFGLATYASAADIAAPLPVVKGPVAYSAYEWSGVYIGGHIGGGWEKTAFSDPSAAHIYTMDAFGSGSAAGDIANGASASDARPSSFLGGLQAGWMYQIGRLVVGGDFDFSWTRLNGSGLGVHGVEVVPPDFVNEAYSVNTKWTGTATTTIGVARDRVLFYGKAGVAWARHDYTLASNGFSVFQGAAGAPFAYGPATASDTLVGWTVGTGVKWAFAGNWFLNLEYDYMDFGSKAQDFISLCVSGGTPCATVPAAAVPATFNPTFYHQISEVKVGLNYKFPAGTFLFW